MVSVRTDIGVASSDNDPRITMVFAIRGAPACRMRETRCRHDTVFGMTALRSAVTVCFASVASVQ